MGRFALFGGGSNDNAANLMAEANWAQQGGGFETPIHIDAFPDEGAVYVSDSEGEHDTAAFHYGDSGEADSDLLSALNSGWGRD